MDDGWAKLREPWQRVAWARLNWQRQIGSAETKRAAAESLGMNENTYSAYERDPSHGGKTIPLDHQRAIEFARKFKSNWVWLLTGEETPFGRSPAQTRAVEILAAAPEEVQEAGVEIMASALKTLMDSRKAS